MTCLYLYMPIFSHISVYYILLMKSINNLLEINDFKILRLLFESAHWKCLLKLNNLPEEFVSSYWDISSCDLFTFYWWMPLLRRCILCHNISRLLAKRCIRNVSINNLWERYINSTRLYLSSPVLITLVHIVSQFSFFVYKVSGHTAFFCWYCLICSTNALGLYKYRNMVFGPMSPWLSNVKSFSKILLDEADEGTLKQTNKLTWYILLQYLRDQTVSRRNCFDPKWKNYWKIKNVCNRFS